MPNSAWIISGKLTLAIAMLFDGGYMTFSEILGFIPDALRKKLSEFRSRRLTLAPRNFCKAYVNSKDVPYEVLFAAAISVG